MKLFSRFLPQSRHFGVAKTDALFTVIGLIFLAYLFAVSISLLIPKILDKFLPDSPPPSEGMKIFVGVIVLIISAAPLALFSWDMVNARVSSAIDAGVAESISSGSQKHVNQIEQLQYQLQELRRDKENSERGYEVRQDLEFRSVVRLEVAGDENLEISLRKAIRARNSRYSIMKQLACNESILKKIALKATKEIFYPKNSITSHSLKWIPNDKETLFREDLYVYLSAWLMHSIENTRLMDSSIIEQRYPNKLKYIEALTYIKRTLIKDSLVSNLIDPEYRADAVIILGEYLEKLILQLKSLIAR